jgi:hypothetical protein
MPILPGNKNFITSEETQFEAPASENTMQRIGESINWLNDFALGGVQVYTSGSGTFTVPDGVTRLIVFGVGGGGGGGGASATNFGAGNGSNGGNTTLGSLVFLGGLGGQQKSGVTGTGLGGKSLRVKMSGNGGDAQQAGQSTQFAIGGTSMSSSSGGGGASFGNGANGVTFLTNGLSAAANSGGGGSGGTSASVNLIAGGGEGGDYYSIVLPVTPNQNLSYAVGAGGAGGTAGFSQPAQGGNGGSGFLRIAW